MPLHRRINGESLTLRPRRPSLGLLDSARAGYFGDTIEEVAGFLKLGLGW
jgi:hypothetical protein